MTHVQHLMWDSLGKNVSLAQYQKMLVDLNNEYSDWIDPCVTFTVQSGAKKLANVLSLNYAKTEKLHAQLTGRPIDWNYHADAILRTECENEVLLTDSIMSLPDYFARHDACRELYEVCDFERRKFALTYLPCDRDKFFFNLPFDFARVQRDLFRQAFGVDRRGKSDQIVIWMVRGKDKKLRVFIVSEEFEALFRRVASAGNLAEVEAELRAAEVSVADQARRWMREVGVGCD